MHWCCFLFWFWYRFTLALLAHFNWLVSIYVNCVYFISWKSYDLLWFWMHLMLCICFKPLRAENYLIVWCNLINKRINRYPNNTYKVSILNLELARRENRDRKVLRKRLRELAIILKHEARQKVICNAIELLLQILRMITSFMILVGNVRKTFMFSLQSGRYANHNIGLMLLLRCTVFLDIFLFWTNIMWAYCLQWHLCCRLGLIKFWSWIIILVIIGSVFMLYPMSYIHDNLDFSWCRFQFNSTLAQYQPSW
ncbi:unnamed protein product [Thelazia callipaeda]|uniref:G_PROTEIN_RECEP_F1_2 domain-containing protein n=1 Tax=Thelazia callipaeda TaxID=103827 RepID=A0A0N5D0G1_THECL|nr:unnamed protein product [Thelazia callipaeda]